MADNKSYYYLKLKEGFFDSLDMKLLQGMKDGYIYSDILLKLYLQSLRQDGRLMYRGIIPYTPEMIATLTNHQVGTIEKAMKVLANMGFIEILDNGAIYMLDIQNFIGKSSTEADRKREYRNLINAEKSILLENPAGQMSDQTDNQMSDISIPENRDKSLENRDKRIEINNTLCTEQAAVQSIPEPEPIITLPLNTGEEYPIFADDIAEFAKLYPAVDVLQAMRGMRGWCMTNPAKRKTKRGIKRFINSWLAKEQDKGGTAGYGVQANKHGDRLNELLRENRGDIR